MATEAVVARSETGALGVRLKFSRPRRIKPFDLDVSFDVRPGITILFGPSGAGKSTLLDCIAGLARPAEAHIALGDAILHDTESDRFVAPQRRNLAYLFHTPALFPHMNVLENVEFGLRSASRADKQARVNSLLEMFRVSHLAGRGAARISGGEAQRVALARALATAPRAVLLDEPLKGLDADLRSAIVDDLRAWNRANPVPILYVTHHRDEVDALGERVIALDRGRVVGEGAPHAVLDAPRTKRLARAAGFENYLSATILELREADGVMRARVDHTQTDLELPLGYAAVGDQVRVAIRAGDILLAVQKPAGLSARNILEGAIDSLEARGGTVVCRVNADANFLVHVTPGALRSLELEQGKRVWLIIKTHSCHLLED